MERYQGAAAEYGRLTSIARKEKDGTFDQLDEPTIAYLAKVFQRNMHEGAEASVKSGSAKLNWDGWDWMIDEYRQWRVEQDVDEAEAHWGRWARGLLDMEGLTIDLVNREGFGRLCMALNDAAIGMSGEAKARLAGDVIPMPPEPRRPQLNDAQDGAAKSGLSFPEIIEKLHSSPLHKLSETTKETGRTALRYFREAFGDLRPEEIDRMIVTEWLELLAMKPSAPTRADRKVKLRELVKLHDGQDIRRLTPKTVEQYLTALSALWRRATEDGLISGDVANPFSGRKVPQAPRPKKKMQFSLTELQDIFNLPIFTELEKPKGGKGDASYWMPLLLLWTGARPEEIAQLLVSDVEKDPVSGLWLLDITDEGMHPYKGRRLLKTTSTGSGHRSFPLPQGLLELGFIRYVEHTRASGEQALFSELRPKGKRNYLHSQWASWWGGYLRSAKILPPPDSSKPRKPVREFRDVWATAARASRLPREVMEYVMGHTPPGATSNETYGLKGPLGEQIDNLRFNGLDLSAIKPWEAPQ